MKKLTRFKRAVALMLCAALLCVPLLGLAAPAAEAGTVDSSTVSSNEAPEKSPTVGESAAPETPEATEPGTEEPTPEPPACFCDVKCTATALNADCPACVADVAGCKGKEPEKCSCDVKCAEGAANEACPVCVADASKCEGKEPAPPVCSCSVKCAAGTVNVDCPVCKLDMTGCTGKAPEPTPAPTPSYTITIISPSGWYTKAADVEIRIEDVNDTGWQKVEAKIERGGSWIDLTDDLTDRNRAKVEITENCTVYVTVTDKGGKAHTKSRYIECFDRTAPTLRAGIDGRLLRVEASDELSGVDAVYIDGDRYDDLTNGTLDVRLRDLDDDYKQLSVQAVDNAGNKSKTVQLNNPNYEEPDSKRNSKDKDDEKGTSTSCPDTTKPATTPAPTPTTPTATTTPTTTTPTVKPTGSTGTSGGASTSTGKTAGGASSSQPVKEERDPDPLTPDGQATVVDNATDEDGKEFYTIVTPAENTFYLIIDKQRETENVYFLNAVTESDLLALAEQDKETGSATEPVTPTPEKCSCKPKCEAGAVNTKCPVCKLDLSGCEGAEPEAPAPDTETDKKEAPKKNNTGAMVIVVLVILAVGGAGYYFKVVKPKKELDDADDFEDIQFEDAPADGEADELPEPEDYADDPDEYEDDEPSGDTDGTEDKEGGV